MLAARTGLIQLISQLSTEERVVLAERINRAKIPAKWTRLFGPKVMARPENLAPGEYEVFATLAPAFLLHGTRDELRPIAKLSMEDKEFWVTLSEAFKELWYAPCNIMNGGK
jgi:acetyl esterase/lipase